MKLQGKLDAMREDFENGRFPLVPTRHQIDTMARATQALIDSGQADHTLKAGHVAPDFTLNDADGNRVSSRALLVPLLQLRAPGTRGSPGGDRGARREPRRDLAPDTGKQPQVAARQQAWFLDPERSRHGRRRQVRSALRAAG
jgi:hypothetical protein